MHDTRLNSLSRARRASAAFAQNKSAEHTTELMRSRGRMRKRFSMFMLFKPPEGVEQLLKPLPDPVLQLLSKVRYVYVYIPVYVRYMCICLYYCVGVLGRMGVRACGAAARAAARPPVLQLLS